MNKFDKLNSEMEVLFNELETSAKYNVQNPIYDKEIVFDIMDGIVRGQLAISSGKEKKELKKIIKFLLKYI